MFCLLLELDLSLPCHLLSPLSLNFIDVSFSLKIKVVEFLMQKINLSNIKHVSFSIHQGFYCV